MKYRKPLNFVTKISLFTLLSLPAITHARITLPAFFNDNMVLQRNATVKIWGWANTGEEVILTTGWDNAVYKVKANNQAQWNLTINTPGAGGPYTLNFKGYNQINLKNVMLGEVWLVSGQSNMEWTANSGIDNAYAEVAQANYPDIRFFTVAKVTADAPQLNLPGDWQVCTPETMKYATAIGYFFAQKVHKDLENVPVGIINTSWGGTPAEIWFPVEDVAKDPVVAEAASKLKPAIYGPTEPGRTWNAMVNPLAGFKIAGVLWYQGESNVGSTVYNKTLGALINSWRTAWGYEFPFYFVQIAPYKYGEGDWGVQIRNSQRLVLNEVANTAMAVISDIGNINDIHPRDKKSVGIRLANMALTKIYKVNNNLVESPLFKALTIKGNTAEISFDNAKGLYFKGKTSNLFEVAGQDGVFHPAKAKIKKDKVYLISKNVKTPVYVRFAWGNTAEADIFNSANLPASSFTTENIDK
ncbi:sialate O-acetylesterase [Flavobacterium akiainvivens]|uniref:Sialate O-acetylesterase n=1 Tax=Flavobacterium akiainvivens TaxID=1202724 RepID=A0A0M9VHR9_9FLAO|nr:sialate O-acetylesterase [Flavobacterium akiainvivens]KOS05852.1 sialate O-acetylesterase [Flavobacterium akiainvivens]SFQ56777.1 sialate O-acetylesterase [Flavobacterium akiainvivens]